MSKYEINGAEMAPIPAKSSTLLLFVNNQLGFRNVEAWGTGVSNPNFESNTKALLAAFRKIIDSKPEGEQPGIKHAQYRPVWTDHPLHVSKVGPYGPNGEEVRAIDFMEFCAVRKFDEEGKEYFIETFDEPLRPREDEKKPKPDAPKVRSSNETIMTSHGHSVFITGLDEWLKMKGIRTLLIAGMSTGCNVSTAVRMAQNLALVARWGGKGNLVDTDASKLWTDGEGVYGAMADSADPNDPDGSDGLAVNMPRIILIGDATRAFGRGGIDAQTVHDVHIENLKDFAEVRTTAEVLKALG